VITFSPAKLTPVSSEEQRRGVWMVDEPIQVAIFGLPWLTIPAGFQTDGASIPWWASRFFDEWGPDALPGILHDYLLTLPMPKWTCDLMFYAALRSQNVSELHSAFMYLAVRTRPPSSPTS
jgi:hypothetical protein